MKYRITVYISLFQLSVIVILLFNIYSQKNVLGISVNQMPNGSLQYFNTSELNHFYEPIPGVQSDPNKKFKIYNSINKDTLNERFDYKPEKETDTFRIVTLGDSFTFGLHVLTMSNWTEILENLLNEKINCNNIQKFEILNLGVSGYDRKYAVERFKRRGVKYEPDLIIWLDLNPFRDTEIIHRKLEALPSSIPPTIKYKDYFLKTQKDIISNTPNVLLEKSFVDSTLEIDNYFTGKLILLSFPFISPSERSALRKIAELRQNTHYFENLPDIYNEKLVFENDGHPNEEGHKRIATDIFEYLNEAKIIPCN